MDVEGLQLISYYTAASRYKDFACLSEPEHFGDAVSALEDSKQELVRKVQECGVGFILRFDADTTLDNGENHFRSAVS